MAIFFLILSILAFVGVAIAAFTSSDDQTPEKLTQIRAENVRAVSNWRQNRAEEFKNWVRNMENRYGKIDSIEPIITSDTQKTLLIFKDKGELYYSSKWLKFEDITNCQLIDNPKIVNGTVIAETKGNVWNEITRSSMQKSFGKTAGTWLAGPERYTTEYRKTPDKVYHNYSILISTKDILNPIFEIKVGDAEQVAYRINAIINAIMMSNNNS